MLAERTLIDATRAVRQPTRPLRWLAIGCVTVALASLGWLIYNSLLVRPDDHGAGGLAFGDTALAMILAAAITGAGVVSLVWILFTASSRARSVALMPAELRQASLATAGASTLARTVGLTDGAGRSVTGIDLTNPVTQPSAEVMQALRDRLRIVRDLTHVGYWQQDESGTWTSVEPAHHDSQYRLAELVGRTRGNLAIDGLASEALSSLQSRIDARQAFRDIVWRCRLPSGLVLILRESGLPRFAPTGRFAGYHGTIEEVSNLVLDPVRNRRVTQALGSLTTPIMLLHRYRRDGENTGWHLVWANAGLSNLTERSEVELGELDPQRWLLCAPNHADGTPAQDSVPAGNGSALSRLLAAGSAHRGPGLVIDRYGRRRPVLLTVERIDDETDGQLALIAADPIAAELGSLRSQAAEIHRAQREESRRALEMEVTKRELESFSHTVSHDLRHPVRIVDGFARMLQDDYAHVLDRTGLDHVNRILSASHRMNAMIDALIDLHRISAQPIASDPVDLSALATSIADELRASDPQRAVTIHIEPHLACRGDRVLLRMALFNLLENAWKYTARREDAHIAFDSVTLYDTLVYRVSDNGAGFDMRYADRLFDLFHRLHGQADFKGTGVGLATVQRAIRRHGGRIWAESAPGEGARFQFTLWDESAAPAVAAQPDP